MSQMGSIDRDSFSRVLQYTHIFPDDLAVSERGPSMDLTLGNKLILGSANWGNKKWLASNRVEECNGSIGFQYNVFEGSALKVPCSFGEMSVKVANLIGKLVRDSKQEI